MHLFFFDQNISFDMAAPIIYKLSKEKQRVYICNFNKVQNLDQNKVYNYLLRKKNISIITGLDSNISYKLFFFFFVRLTLILPPFIMKRLYKYWKYVWENVNFISKEKIIDIIENNKIKTISFDESLVKKKRIFLLEISKITNTPLIMNHGGLYTVKSKNKNKLKFKQSSYYLSPNKFPIITYNLSKNYFKSKKYNQIGSPRFDIEWLEKLNYIYKSNYKKNYFFKLAIFARPTSTSHESLKLIDKLKKLKNIKVRINYKPRDVWPTKISNTNRSEMQSSDLICWADIVVSYSTSIILEVISRNKPLIYLDYLQIDKKGDRSWFSHIKFIKTAKNTKQLMKLINNFKNNSKDYIVKGRNKKNLLKKFINEPNGKKILEKYFKFYNSFTY